MIEMNKRIYGIIGISAIMSNWNADFSHAPKTTGDGTIYGSDKALKYTMRAFWDTQEEEKVFFMKSTRTKGDALIVRNLINRYNFLFNGSEDDKKVKDSASEVLKNLFKCIDVKNFGATFAASGVNLSVTGAAQIGQGFNLHDKADIIHETIISPFANSGSGEDKKNSTIGSRIICDEAHYFYPFAINPTVYREFEEMGVGEEAIEGAVYTEEDYLKFKKAALCSATAFSTSAKVGCDNEFALFIETPSDYYLPSLTEYIQFNKEKINGEEKNIITFADPDLLAANKGIEEFRAEVYYNKRTTILQGFDFAKTYDIVKNELL